MANLAFVTAWDEKIL